MEKCTSMEYAATAVQMEREPAVYAQPHSRILGLSGYARTGKDTVAQTLVNKYGYTRLAFGDAVRDGVYAMNPIVDFRISTSDGRYGETSYLRVRDIVDAHGWDYAKDNYIEVRELLQRYGTEAGRNIHGMECWTSILDNIIASNPGKKYIITDIRFENEYELVRKYNGICIRVVRDGIGAVNNHVSDMYIPSFTYTIDNSGTKEELELQIEKVLGGIL